MEHVPDRFRDRVLNKLIQYAFKSSNQTIKRWLHDLFW